MLLGTPPRLNEGAIGGGLEPPDRCMRGNPQRRDFEAKTGPVYRGLTGVDLTVGDRSGLVSA